MQRPGAARYVLDEMVADALERIEFLRHEPRNVLTIGDAGEIGFVLASSDCQVSMVEPLRGFDEEAPFGIGGFDTVISLGTLDTVNDLPGALVHIRNALAPGGLAIASFVGAGSLPNLRAAMLATDGERPAPRMHPMVDVRAAGQLLMRAGWARPVVDSWPIRVRTRSLLKVISDLRDMGLTNVLVQHGPPLRYLPFVKALQSIEGEFIETFEMLTLTGWRA